MFSRTAKKAQHSASRRINRSICLLVVGLVFVTVAAPGAQEALNAQSSPPPAPTPAPGPVPALAPAAQVSPSQPPASSSPPIAIVPIDASVSGAALSVAGQLHAWKGRAFFTSSGEITAGPKIAQVTLPYRGSLNVCPSTTVKLSVDSSVPVSQVPGLLIAFEAGALEANFAIARNSDVVLTPQFRIFIGGPGSADVKVRLGKGGDTCVDNAGANGPYVVVTSVFEGGLYRVQPGQRVMFAHGSLQSVVEEEKEPCGCPTSANAEANEFPLAESEGLTRAPQPASGPANPGSGQAPQVPPLVYNGAEHAQQAATRPQPSPPPAAAAPTNLPANPPANPPATKKKRGFFGKVGHFFRRAFGAE